MSARTNDFKLGLFVLVGLALLAAALFMFMGTRLFFGNKTGETYVAENVEGLKHGAPVTLHGVPIGEITRIDFTCNEYNHPELRYVLIEFSMHKDVSPELPGRRFDQFLAEQVRQGLRARVKPQGLAGAVILSLEYVNPSEYPALRVPWTPHHVYVPSAPSQMSEIIAGLDQTLRNIAKTDFARLGDQLERDLVLGEGLLKHFDQADIARLSTNADALLSNLRQLSSQITTFIGDTNAALNRPTLQQVSADTDKALVELQVSVRHINQLLANLEVSPLNETLANLRRTSEELEDAVTKVEEYPSGLLFGKPPPPAKSVRRTSR